MDRYAFLADLVTLAAGCVDNIGGGCKYDVFVAPGEPPADCSHIAGYWTGSTIMSGSDKCLIKVREQFSVSLNQCCLKNVGDEFDPALEDQDAKCFIDDFGALFECLVCGVGDVLKPYVRTCQDVIVRMGEPNPVAEGGCYGGVVEVAFTRLQSCC